MTKTIITSIVISAIVASLMTFGFTQLVGDNQSAGLLGGSRFQSGLSTGDTNPSAGDLIVSDDVILEASAFCIDFHATSTATQLKMTASSTATIEGVDGVMMFEYGSCQ